MVVRAFKFGVLIPLAWACTFDETFDGSHKKAGKPMGAGGKYSRYNNHFLIAHRNANDIWVNPQDEV
jgi:hypothetical protein